MDGRGRIAESLRDGFARVRRRAADFAIGAQRLLRPWLKPLLDLDPPRGLGVAASTVLLLASAGYGAACGGYGARIVQELKDLRDATANAAGFRIASVSIAGQYQLTTEEILSAVGVTGHSSLLFLDAVWARAQLKALPWVADATVLKLYPDRLYIELTEREPFALWQKEGKVSVISADGVVLETVVAQQFAGLPFVVGVGAEKRAKEFLAVIEKYPALREQVYASVLVAERRWDLKLKNGIAVQLPENQVEQALDMLVKLDHEKKLLSRDIVSVDLRLADRVTVRLSDDAAQAFEESVRERELERDKKFKRKGGAA
jgi:cell division protein FtsQ